MNKRIKRLLMICVICLLAAGWTWRYFSLNAYWESTIPEEYTETVYSLGQTVTFGKDMYKPEGYSICVNSCKTMDYEAYLSDNGIDSETMAGHPPDKLVILDVTLSFAGEEEKGISLLEFTLHGIDSYFSFSPNLIAEANSILNGSTGVPLRNGESHDFVLIYEVRDEYLNSYTRKHFNSYPLYLQTTVYPSLQEIRVQ